LETRRLFAGSSVKDGVLRVYGDAVDHNIITLAQSTDGKDVDVSVSWVTPSGVKKNFSSVVPIALGFSKINIFGGNHADTVTIDNTKPFLGLKVRIDTGKGNDTINTGAEADVIYAGMGNDTVNSGGGNDLIYGGDGADSLSGGAGNDTIWGGHGADSIYGNDGDDKLGGVLGDNTLMGGAGKDTFVVKSLSDNPVNDYNSSQDVLVTKGADAMSDVDAPAGV
jgi:Ca2+-binding RTX toxin-like protein